MEISTEAPLSHNWTVRVETDGSGQYPIILKQSVRSPPPACDHPLQAMGRAEREFLECRGSRFEPLSRRRRTSNAQHALIARMAGIGCSRLDVGCSQGSWGGVPTDSCRVPLRSGITRWRSRRERGFWLFDSRSQVRFTSRLRPCATRPTLRATSWPSRPKPTPRPWSVYGPGHPCRWR